MLVVGLTGGIATGKSTVSNTLKEKHHLTVIDADLIAREVVYPGRRAYNHIVAAFGLEVALLVNDDKSLNREALGKHVFGNKHRLAQLNAIVHPAVRYEIGWRILMAYLKLQKVVILDVPLLFEAKLHMICGKTITVSCDRSLQVQRLLERNKELSPEDAEKRISSQMSNEEKCFRADLIIDNNHGITELEKNVDLVVKEITPSTAMMIVDLFPPFGVLSAFLTIVVRYFRDRFKEPMRKQE